MGWVGRVPCVSAGGRGARSKACRFSRRPPRPIGRPTAVRPPCPLTSPQLDKTFGYESAVEAAQGALLAAKTEAFSAYRWADWGDWVGGGGGQVGVCVRALPAAGLSQHLAAGGAAWPHPPPGPARAHAPFLLRLDPPLAGAWAW